MDTASGMDISEGASVFHSLSQTLSAVEGLHSANHQHSSQDALLRSMVDETPRSLRVVRPCYYLLQVLGMWKPRDGNFKHAWQLYRLLVHLLWLGSLVGIMCLDFIHYGFREKKIHVGEIMNSFPTCFNLLCPFVFTLHYFNSGQFVELVWSVQWISLEYEAKLKKISRYYTALSLVLWILGAAFFIVHWTPFFSKKWHYIFYVTIIVYTTGWWAVWLSIYGFVCQVHSLQIDNVVEAVRSKDCAATMVLYRHQELQNSLERTQQDFNIIISFSLLYHTVDIIIFSFAYFDSAFGSRYKLWQYVGGILFDLISIIIKLIPPAAVAAAVHRIVIQAAKRCQVTPLAPDIPLEDIQLFQYMVSCEPDMGLKILGICITVELVGKILMTITTAAVSFVAFVVPRLK